MESTSDTPDCEPQPPLVRSRFPICKRVAFWLIVCGGISSGMFLVTIWANGTLPFWWRAVTDTFPILGPRIRVPDVRIGWLPATEKESVWNVSPMPFLAEEYEARREDRQWIRWYYKRERWDYETVRLTAPDFSCSFAASIEGTIPPITDSFRVLGEVKEVYVPHFQRSVTPVHALLHWDISINNQLDLSWRVKQSVAGKPFTDETRDRTLSIHEVIDPEVFQPDLIRSWQQGPLRRRPLWRIWISGDDDLGGENLVIYPDLIFIGNREWKPAEMDGPIRNWQAKLKSIREPDMRKAREEIRQIEAHLSEAVKALETNRLVPVVAFSGSPKDMDRPGTWYVARTGLRRIEIAREESSTRQEDDNVNGVTYEADLGVTPDLRIVLPDDPAARMFLTKLDSEFVDEQSAEQDPEL